MVISLLRLGRNTLRAVKPIRHAFVATGVLKLGRRVYEYNILKRGEMSATLYGQRLRFVAESRREIRRIDTFATQEARFVEKMLAMLRPGDVVWDVGANIGVISMVLAKASGAMVHAFEPEPRNFAHLERNIAMNGLEDRVIPHRLALGDHDAEVELHVDGEVGDGRHSLVSNGAPSGGTIPIRMTTAAQYAKECGAVPTFVKIDVEGAEIHVAEGFADLFANGRVRVVCVEIHPKQLAQQGYLEGYFAEHMANCGYVESVSSRRMDEQHQVFTL